MEKQKYVIDFEKIKENGHSVYTEIANLIYPVKEVAINKLGENPKMYICDLYEIERIIADMFEQEKFETLAKFDDLCADGFVSINFYNYNKTVNEKSKLKSIALNHILYDNNFNVVIGTARIPEEGRLLSSYYTIIFGVDKESVEKFIDYLLKEYRDSFINKKMLIISDSSNGPIREHVNIDNSITRNDVFLEQTTKDEVFNSIDAFFNDNGTFYKKFNLPYRRGILFYGRPGNGKTTLSKAISHTINAPVIYWQVNEFATSLSIDRVFNDAMRLSPALLVIEDIDSLPASCRSTFLNKLDGTTKNEGIFLIGTTNFPEKIDPALMNRAGRFDRTYEIEDPTEETKFNYLVQKGLLNFATKEEIREALKHMNKFSMAALNEFFTSIALDYYYNKEVDLLKLVKTLNELGEKQIKNNWHEKDKNRIGF